ncbi:MAG: serpin family protein [Bacillota bacterium]|nr:serpin family protein [Bacillota bacterium]
MFKYKIILIAFVFMLALTGCSVDDEVADDVADEPIDIAAIDQVVVDANENFAIDIFKALNSEDSGDNIFISPLSISTALSMTYNGALEQTKEDMGSALGYLGIDLETVNSTYKNLINYLEQADKEVELLISNSIWYREGEVIKEEFIDVNKEFYDAKVSALNFSDDKSVDTINNWINDSTKGKIEKMLTPPIDPDVIMYLINAIYFKGEWTDEFDESNTYSTDFKNIDNEKESIEMMQRKGEVAYTESADYKAVRLPYGQEKTAMYVVLPSEDTYINAFIQEFDIDKFDEIKENMMITDDVNLQIPKFKLEYGIKNLNDSLISLGMASAFDTFANFDKIREDIFISRVLHKAVIEVNEKGSEAAAVTVVEMALTSMPLNPIEFIADRPFLFIISDEETDTILFIGKYSRVE